MRIYTGLGWSPTSSLRDDRVRVPRLGARMVEEVEEPKLGDGQPEEKL